jgi:hypothetical protein
MTLYPMPPYFIVRVPRKDISEKREKIGNLYFPPSFVFLTRECQASQIVAIGEDAAAVFPEAKIGNILLHHHFVTGKEKENADEGRYHIASDDTFNYYSVTVESHDGRGNETYGIFNGKEIIPHPEFIFLEKENNNDIPEEFKNQVLRKTSGGLLTFNRFVESREELRDKNKRLQDRVKSLHNLGNPTFEILREIEKLESEMLENSRKLNKKSFDPYIVAATNPILEEWFGTPVNKGDIVYVLNIAAGTTIDYMKKEYRVVKIQYVGCPHNFFKKAVDQYKLKSA